MPHSCTNLDCTVAATGKCVLLKEPLESCPNYKGAEEAAPLENTATPTAVAEETGRTFHSGFELGSEDVAEIMRARYGTLVAILGQYDVGKTCFLVSLYLLTACRAASPELAFAGSLTLNGFEARARRMRKWKGGALPKQLADHTRLADPRQAAIMHLAVKEIAGDQRRYDLLVTDLPGEWSTDLIKDASTASRLDFLKRADGIVITLDGPMLSQNATRHGAVNNAQLLITRLAATVKVDRSTPLVLMVTKCDELAMKVPASVESIAAHARDAGFAPVVVPVAAISRTPNEVPSGTGVMQVIEHILDRKGPAAPTALPVRRPASPRQFANIGGGT